MNLTKNAMLAKTTELLELVKALPEGSRIIGARICLTNGGSGPGYPVVSLHIESGIEAAAQSMGKELQTGGVYGKYRELWAGGGDWTVYQLVEEMEGAAPCT